MNVAGRPRPQAEEGAACHRCTRARGIQQEVRRRSRHEDVVCHRHKRWVGDGHALHGASQPSLVHQPEILRANIRHRKMVRNLGRTATATAFYDADHIIEQWHLQWNAHDEGFSRRMRLFFGHSEWRLHPNEPVVHAATYPQVVALARVLASPYWRSLAIGDENALDQFVQQIRRHVAPKYRLSRDRLVRWIEEERDRHHGYRRHHGWGSTIAKKEAIPHGQGH